MKKKKRNYQLHKEKTKCDNKIKEINKILENQLVYEKKYK